MFQFDTNESEKTLGLAVFKADRFIMAFCSIIWSEKKHVVSVGEPDREKGINSDWCFRHLVSSCLPAALPADD